MIAAAARAQFVERATDVSLRDAILDATGAMLYATSAESGEILKIDTATGSVVARVSVGKSPGAIASDGNVLACVVRSAKTVALVRIGDFSRVGEAKVGDGADEIAALPGGGFAVVNSFSDSVTLIDPAHAGAPVEIGGVSSVPSGIAASESFLAVSTRSPAQLLIFAGGSHTPISTVPLPEGPSKVVALASDKFAVMAKSSIVVVDAASARITASVDVPARDIAPRGDRLLVLGPSSVEMYDSALANNTSVPARDDARTITASASGFALLAPNAKSWSLCSALPASAKSVQVASASVDSTKPEVPESKTKPAASSAPDALATPAPGHVKEVVAVPVEAPTPADNPEPSKRAAPEPAVASANPVPAAAAPATAQAPAPEPAVVASEPMQTPPAAEPDKADVSDKSDQSDTSKRASKYKSQSQPWPERKSRIRPGGEVPQPEMTPRLKPKSKRPEVSPIESGVSKETSIGQAVTEGISTTPQEGGFTPPTSTDEFLNVQGDNVDWRPDGSIVADGNVRFTLAGAPDVQFAADHLDYDATTGRMFASGSVEIVQGPSSAFADEILTTIYPGNTKLRTPPPLTGAADTEDDLTKKLLSIGNLEAKNIDIIEPARRLRAERIIYDFQTQTGVMYNLEGQAGQIRFGGDELQMEGENKGEGKNLWLTTCDCDHEYYRIRVKEVQLESRGGMLGKGAQLEIGNSRTPVYWPRWSYSGGPTPTAGIDFYSGKKAELGYYINVGQQFAVTPDLRLGYRLFPTTKEGVGIGFDGSYDYMQTPASPLFRGAGEFHALGTTQDRGYYEWYHRQELTPDTVLLMNFEQWGDKDFYKDFFYDLYKDRTAPRNFVNVTYTQPGYIATATVRKDTHDFVSETERLPEVTFHLLERELLPHLYLTFDTIDGYNERKQADDDAFRSINVARLTTDIEFGSLINVTPFLEMEASYYSKTRDRANNDDSADGRFSALVGATVQSRFQKTYDGAWGFSGFKHIVIPSITYSYRTEPTLGVEETPRFDAYDNVYGRSRIESKIDNIVMGKDAETGETWQVARLSLYQGNDFWNEIRKSKDYEIEIDIRPRSWWGIETIGEHHSINKEGDIDLDEPYLLQRALIEWYERILDRPFDAETADKYNTRYGDYDRILTYFYYDNRDFGGNINGRVGFAYTKTQDEVFNREILYGLGYRINEKWSVAFEHRYDLERGELHRQKYEVRRVMNCLEGAILINERGSGWDFGVELSVTGIPGTRIRF